jgi:hypothetical protein
MQVYSTGTLSDSLTALGSGVGERTVCVIMRNPSGGGSRSVELAVNDVTIAHALLGENSTCVVDGLELDPDDAIKALASEASEVVFVSMSSKAKGFSVKVTDANGGLVTKTEAPVQSMTEMALAITGGRNPNYTVMDTTGGAGLFSIEGTLGTSTFLQGEAAQNNTKTDKCIFELCLPPEYTAGADLTLTVNVQRVVASGTTLTTTLDAEVWEMSDAGAASSNLCETTVITFTDTSGADKNFTIDGAALQPGDRLIIQLTGVATEGGDAGTVLVRVNSVRVNEAA